MGRPVSGRDDRSSVQSYRPFVRGEDTRLRQLLADWPLPTEDRFGCYLVPGSSQHSDLARAVECSVFQNFFGNDPSIMCAEYGPYEEHSTFVLVVDRELEQPAGTLRLIASSSAGLKSLNDIAREPLSIPLARVMDCHRIETLDTCWDIATVAVMKEYRRSTSHLISTMLYGVVTDEALRGGISHCVAIMDQHVFSQLTELLALPFVPIASSQPFEYLGSSVSRATIVALPQVRPSVDERLKKLETLRNELDEKTLSQWRTCLTRVAFAHGLPELVRVV